jgi:hypothetical protein
VDFAAVAPAEAKAAVEKLLHAAAEKSRDG